MLKVAICEDNRVHSDLLKEMLLEIDEEGMLISSFLAAKPLLAELKKNSFDILFLDIQLQEESGIDLGMKVRTAYPYTKIIYVTGYMHYAQDIFETEPSYLLFKPISKEKLCKALEWIRAQRSIADQSDALGVTCQGKVVNIRYSEIQFIESVKRVVHIYCGLGGEYQTYCKLDDLEIRLPNSFLRCHKSYIVNLNHVKKQGNAEFLLYSGAVVPISQRRANDVRNAFFEFVGDI